MDVLSDVLNTLHLQSSVHCYSELTAPWGLAVPGKPGHAGFLVITRGSCLLEAASLAKPLFLGGGDFVVLPRGGAYVIRDQPDSAVKSLTELVCLEKKEPKSCQGLKLGGGGVMTSAVLGCFEFAGGSKNPLLSALPAVINVRSESSYAVPWLEDTLKFVACEAASQRPGAAVTILRLTDILFIQAVRAYISNLDSEQELLELETVPINQSTSHKDESEARHWDNGQNKERENREREIKGKKNSKIDGKVERKLSKSQTHSKLVNGQGGWLRALMDNQIGKALQAIHARPQQDWTVEELALTVAMSRSAFSARFTALVGLSPLAYVTRWRMQRASEMIRHQHLSLGEVAMRVGYESEAAFRKAFKRETGVAPGAYRRETQVLKIA
jgi:AraC-like DNA-binding protein